MFVDSRMEKLYQSLQGITFYDQMELCLSGQEPFSGLKLKDLNVNSNLINQPVNPNSEDHQEDYDFSDLVLNYINQVLMEEDEEEKEKDKALQDSSAFEATEKSLYEAIGKEYPVPELHDLSSSRAAKLDSLNENSSGDCSTSSVSVISFDKSIEHGLGGFNSLMADNLMRFDTSSSSLNVGNCRVPDLSPTQSGSSSLNSTGNHWGVVIDGHSDSPRSQVKVPDFFNDSQSIIQFNKGVEVANRFLPNENSLYVGSGRNIMTNGNLTGNMLTEVSRGKKHRHPEDAAEGGRGFKQSAISEEVDEKQEVYDMVLLCSRGKNDAALRESLQDGMDKNNQISQAKGNSNGKGRGKKKGGRKDVIDISSLLTLCAQAVAAYDQRGANELLKRIRQHSSPTGDGNQRMAHYFADGLEARLAGAGSPVYTFLITGRTSAANLLKAYHMYLATCPFKKLSNFFSNRTIMTSTQKAKKVHIIDLGIVFGFQWPSLLERFANRDGGPPKLKITGVDLPLPGFRPAKRIEETGRRLAKYAQRFGVPFEYNAIAKRWEGISVNDLKIEEDEVLIVNSMYRSSHVQDETVMVQNPRNIVLNLIKKINPKVFIFGVVNGAFGAPFFTTRFREALFHFSTLFDMLEAVAPRDSVERAILEREIFGRQAMNVIACEGVERVERPETYKQWQLRTERIGLKQLPLDKETVDRAKARMKSCYHKDFVIDEDGKWMLQGWKGRILYAVSCWKPAL